MGIKIDTNKSQTFHLAIGFAITSLYQHITKQSYCKKVLTNFIEHLNKILNKINTIIIIRLTPMHAKDIEYQCLSNNLICKFV